MNRSNSTAVSSSSIDSYKMYIGFGSAALSTNIIISIVLFANRKFLLKSPFVFGLTVGDTINGIALLMTGIMRIDYSRANILSALVSPLECLKTFSTLWLIGIQLPTVMMFLIGVERLIAVAFFTWFYNKWTNKLGWLLTGAAFLFCTASIGTIWIVSAQLPITVTVTKSCTTPSVIGPQYSAYNYGLAILGGMVGIVCNLIGLITFLIKKKKLTIKQDKNNASLQKFVKKQWQKTTTMTCVAALDLVFVVLPNVLLLLTAYNISINVGFSVGSWSASFVCLRSSLSLFIYFLLHQEFREKFLITFGCRRVQIHPTLFSYTLPNKQHRESVM